MSKSARCYQEFCDDEATHHVVKGYADLMWGFCSYHHNVAYFYAGRPVYRKPEECNQCKSQQLMEAK